MEENKHTIEGLKQMQALPLDLKIRMTQSRIKGWVDEYGVDGVYVSFSGGKDSTVLLDIVRDLYPDVKAMYVDTGLEYPEIRDSVKTFPNVDWLKPKMNFKEVITKYGYPFISKEVSECVEGARKYLTRLINEGILDRQTDRQTDRPYKYSYDKLVGTGKYSKFSESLSNTELIEREHFNAIRGGTYTTTNTEQAIFLEQYQCVVKDQKLKQIAQTSNARLKMIMGVYQSRKNGVQNDNISQYSQVRYKFFLEAPFEISSKCCNVSKKNPAHKYHKDTGMNPITGQSASESRLRTQQWLKNGCNGFNLKIPTSNPMSFWTEQDVLLYIKLYGDEMVERHRKSLLYYKENEIEELEHRDLKNEEIDEINNMQLTPICKVYGDIVEVGICDGQLTLQDCFAEMEMFDRNVALETTGCNRTGCAFCGFGCHLEKPQQGARFINFEKVSNPKIIDYCMRGGAFADDGRWKPDNRGLGYWFVILWINKHGNFDIQFPNKDKYLREYLDERTASYLGDEYLLLLENIRIGESHD